MRLYAAIFVRDGEIHELSFPARSISEAKVFCVEQGFGLKGLSGEIATAADTSATLTIEEVMCALQLSRSSILRLLAKGSLRRVARIRAVRITRRSLDEYLAS
ncbi:MAG: helix-turn-helix domain-containing protein [Verrucomicrobia bacterium]|nr:helix-turn-helix domain-containing protein [Verrucomicrobiota bacterium]